MEESSDNKTEGLTSKSALAILVLLMAVAFVFRVYALSEPSYWIDEGFTVNAVMSTIEKGFPILDSGFHYSRALLNTYLISGSVALFGFNPFATRIMSVLFGSAFIGLIYFVVNLIFKNKRLSLIVASLVALSYLEISWSRQARMYVQLQFFYFVSLAVFWQLLHKFTTKRVLLLLLATVATVMSHRFGYLLLPFYGITTLLFMFSPLTTSREAQSELKKDVWSWIQQYKYLIGLFSLGAIPWLGYQVWDLLIQPILKLGIGKSENFIGGAYLFVEFNMHWIVITMAILSLFWYALKESSIFPAVFLSLAYLIPLAVIISSTNLFHQRYLFHIYPILLIFAGYLISNIGDLFKKLSKLPLPAIVSTILLVVLVLVDSTFIYQPQVFFPLGSSAPQPNFNGAYQSIRDDGWDDTSIIVSPYVHLDKIYMGRADYWLPIKFTGRTYIHLIDGKDRYTGSELLTDFSLLDNKDVKKYLIIDAMAMGRLGGWGYLDGLKLDHELLFMDKGNNPRNMIWVFKL